jgi:MFS family permease
MYSIDWSKIFSRRSAPATEASPSGEPAIRGWRRHLPIVSPTVWALGVTSLLTDISSEMIASILPVYLVLHLGMSPLAFGIVDGVYQGAAAIVRLAGGVLSDRWRRYKEVAAFGYGLSAACRLLILVAGSSWGVITAIISLDRIGKGVRTAPRDAMIAQSTPKESLATAFGVHRSMDAVGALLGPVLAFALLALLPEAYDVLFVTSFGVAVLGVVAILLFVPRTSAAAAPAAAHSSRPASTWHRSPQFRTLLGIGTLLSLGTISDSFVFLVVQQRAGIGATAFPLLYVGTSLVTSMFAVSCGRMADRHGRTRVLLGGYVVLALLYVVLLLPWGGIALACGIVGLLGLYYAATDGVLTAMAAALLPHEEAGSGLAMLATLTNLARFLASLMFGFLWTRISAGTATWSYLAVLAVAIAGAAFLLENSKPDATRPSIPHDHH